MPMDFQRQLERLLNPRGGDPVGIPIPTADALLAKKIIQRIEDRGAPFILYVNNGAHVVDQMADSGADVISLDWRASLADAATRFGDRVSLQGNLDPCALAAGEENIRGFVEQMAREAEPARGFIVNLGHGCLPGTPVEGVRAFTRAVRSLGEGKA